MSSEEKKLLIKKKVYYDEEKKAIVFYELFSDGEEKIESFPDPEFDEVI